DLVQRDGQRLVGHLGLDQRSDVLQETLGELRVVGVDLAGALGGVDHQGVLGVRVLQQVVDGRVGDAIRVGDSANHVRGVLVVSVRCSAPEASASGVWLRGSNINDTSSSPARETSSFTIRASNSGAAASSVRAVA